MQNFFTVYFLSMLPATELQGGIAYGLTVLHMNPWLAFTAGTLGSLTMAMLLVTTLKPVTVFLRKHSKLIDRFCAWLFARTQAKYSGGLRELGHFALFTYVAIPTPGSGAWTCALIAYLFDVPLLSTLWIMGLGLVCTGLIVTFGVESLLYIFQ